MDLSSLKKNILPLWGKTKTLWKTAKVYGEKALDFTQRQAQSTPIFLKTEEAYNIHTSAKRAVFIAYDEEKKVAQEVLLRSPVWVAKAWMDNAEIRYLSITQNPDLARTLGIVWSIEMRVSYEWYEYLRTNDIGTMKQWWENRRYQKEETPEEQKKPFQPSKDADPLESR